MVQGDHVEPYRKPDTGQRDAEQAAALAAKVRTRAVVLASGAAVAREQRKQRLGRLAVGLALALALVLPLAVLALMLHAGIYFAAGMAGVVVVFALIAWGVATIPADPDAPKRPKLPF